jgi:glycosyltransferase involved in cell wall biosynthesis
VPTHLAIMDLTPDKRGTFENTTVRLAAALEARGWRSVQAFWGPPPRWLEAELRAVGAEILVLSAQPELAGRSEWPAGQARDLALARLLRRLGRTLAPDVVHLHFCVVFSILPLALRAGGVKNVIATERISLPFAERSFARDLAARLRNRVCLSAVKRILAVSGYVRQRLIVSDHVPESMVQVLYNGVDLSRFRPGDEPPARVRARLGIPPDGEVVTVVGQLIDFKGLNYLIDAVDLLRARPLTVLMAGAGDRRDALAAQARRLGLEDRVRLLGKRDDVQALLAASDLFVCPSVWDEALGNVILEAMGTGLPVVASRVGGIPEVVRDGETGLLVPPRDAAALAGAIASLLDDPARRQAMGRAGRRVVEEDFSMERAITATVDLYEELAGVAPGPARTTENLLQSIG